MMRRPGFSIALSALMLIAAMAAKAGATTLKLSVGNPGLQHFDTDGGVQLDFGLTDSNGQPVGNLRPDNVQVFEDGKPAKIIDFRGAGQGRPVDIVFVMDVTESMQPYIDAVKQNMISFARDLQANNRDYRLGLVTFEDYVVSQYADCNCAYRNTLTSNVNEFISWVGSLHAGGGGDIPEDQLDGLAYAASLPFRPDAQVILILITDAPCHVKGDGPDREGDEAYLRHTTPGADVTEQTGASVATLLQKNGITLYAVVPPPFIAPEYAEIVRATHGRSYNIVTEEGHFSELVRELGHSIATEYSLTYLTPRPIEDGTNRSVELKINFDGQSATADTSYQVRGVGGAAINVPEEGGGASANAGGTGLAQLSFNWWNLAVPLIALLGLFGLSRMHFGVSTEELKAIVEAQAQAPIPKVSIGGAGRVPPRPAASPPPGPVRPPSPTAMSNAAGGARLTAIDPVDPIPADFSLLKDEVSVGRGEDNDVVIPHASVSRAHARLMRRNGAYELTDLGSTNGSFVNNQPVQGSTVVANGSEVRFGNIRFILRF
ncbi:MAG TPA: FHA domain-containing protein [Candidatus Binataceae bacterium]|nr:FHA domain-containing protein [Candidatus Binataceae bacterium]